MTAQPDDFEMVINFVKTMAEPLCFAVAGSMLIATRPRWPGAWLLLCGAVIEIGVAPLRWFLYSAVSGNDWVWRAFEIIDLAGVAAIGAGTVLVAWRTRKEIRA